jgi:hypothetical protein
MLTTIRKLLHVFFLLIFLVLSAPTLLFLTKWYYSNLTISKTYIGIITMPRTIEKSEEIIASAKTLFASKDIKAIIVNCDGLGGIPGACQAIFSDLLWLKRIYQKPVISFIEKEALGGSYLIAAAGDEIVSTEGAIIGRFEFYPEKSKSIFIPEQLEDNYRIQFSNSLQKVRQKISPERLLAFKNSVTTGLDLFTFGFVDTIGGNIEIEKILRSKKIITGSIEKIHSSLIEHFIFYVTDLVNRVVLTYKKATNL